MFYLKSVYAWKKVFPVNYLVILVNMILLRSTCYCLVDFRWDLFRSDIASSFFILKTNLMKLFSCGCLGWTCNRLLAARHIVLALTCQNKENVANDCFLTHTPLEKQSVRECVHRKGMFWQFSELFFFSLCGAGRRSSLVFGRAKPVLNMFGIALGCGMSFFLLNSFKDFSGSQSFYC